MADTRLSTAAPAMVPTTPRRAGASRRRGSRGTAEQLGEERSSTFARVVVEVWSGVVWCVIVPASVAIVFRLTSERGAEIVPTRKSGAGRADRAYGSGTHHTQGKESWRRSRRRS